MKTSQILIPTQKEAPNDAQIISHQLMIRAGLISKLASGLYSYLPLGLKVLQKVENIIRIEMNKAGCNEILMPVAQPAELWQESGRWEKYGAELLRFNDRHNRDFCLGPTHEEVITDLVKQYIRSYKQLPINFYQIQTKFRDEIRPRFGLMRGREFIMKDAYSFHIDEASMQDEFDKMHQVYCNIFTKLGLEFRPVLADSGSIGGENSVEFHVIADSGEDEICFSDKSDYAANIDKVIFHKAATDIKSNLKSKLAQTPNIRSINEVCDFFETTADKVVKTLIVKTSNEFIAIALRGDHDLNSVKVNNLIGQFEFATDTQINKLGLTVGSIGINNLNLKLIVDYSAAVMRDFICGSNQEGSHFTHANFSGDEIEADLRNAVAGDDSPCGEGKLIIKRGIEVGHIFQLGNTYSKAMNAGVIGENGKQQIMQMGCYGIGVSRVVAASIEQNFDDKGIIFPVAIAPFSLIIVPINYHKSHRVRELADSLYQQFLDSNIEVLLDDRKERPGIMFKDSELIGIPHRIVISDTHADNGSVEYKKRDSDKKIEVPLEEVIVYIQNAIKQ